MLEDGVEVVAAPNDTPKAGGAVVAVGAPNEGGAVVVGGAPKGVLPGVLKMLEVVAEVVETGVPKVAGELSPENPEAVVVVADGNPDVFGVPKPDVNDAKPDDVVEGVETAPAPNVRALDAGPAEVVGAKLKPPTGVGRVGSAEVTAADVGAETAPKEMPVLVVEAL